MRINRHSLLVIRRAQRLRPAMAMVLCAAVMFAGSPVWSLCLEDDGTAVVESVLRLCCTQDPQHSADELGRVDSSPSDGCRDIFLTLEGMTEPSHELSALAVSTTLSTGSHVDGAGASLCRHFRQGEPASVGHAGSSLLCLQSVRLLT